ncbi:MAG: mechanosensitive ion channel [Chlamydiales bacterium]|nr:mechanosensitive ion channel [Chlamydiales bacterium]
MFAVETAVEPEIAIRWFMATYFGISLWRYMVAMVILAVAFIFKVAFELFFIRWLNRIFAKTNHRYAGFVFDAISPPLNAFILVLGTYLALLFLRSDGGMTEDLARSLTTTIYVAFGLLVVWATYRLVGAFADVLDEVAQHKASIVDRQFVPFLVRCMRIFVLVIGLLTILSTLHVDVGGLLAGLGIGGAAMALAAQDSLGNIFGSVALLADQSIKIGDWIAAGDKVSGSVEAIGLRSTKIRTAQKTLLSIPNKLLANGIIENWSQMPKRRVEQTIGLEYCMPDQMVVILQDFREILSSDGGVEPDSYLVYWTEFGHYSMNIMIQYFTITTAMPDHLECRERINLKLLSATLARGMNIAIRKQTLLLPKQEEVEALC